MKILMGHNHYGYYGGEDAVFETESTLLKDYGQDVFVYKRSNKEWHDLSLQQKISYFFQIGWSKKSYQDIKDILRKYQPDIAHFHNIDFMITPAAYYACQDLGVPVVQSLHNFRPLCANALFYRDQHVCEDCVQKNRWQAIKHKCYRNSRVSTAAVVWMQHYHWRRKTWIDKVDGFITATKFTKEKYIQAGISAERIHIKPNFVYPDIKDYACSEGYVLYSGRFSEEKGIWTLLQAWRTLKEVPLHIMGNGPLEEQIRCYLEKYDMRHVYFHGFVDKERYQKLMRGAKFMVLPSHCYENFPRVLVEAFSYGVPVLASNLGTQKELITSQYNGELFEAQNSDDLKIKVSQLYQQNLLEMQRNAKKTYREKYLSEQNYQNLISIYQTVIQSSKKC